MTTKTLHPKISHSQKPKEILLLVSGSIAAYKSCVLASQLVQKGFSVQVALTPHAERFIGPSTFEGLTGHPPLIDTFESHHAMDHIHWIRRADLILLCPATANTINQMAQGIANNIVTTFFLAHDFKKPFWVAPAMNSAMYRHPITQNSMTKLKSFGLTFLEPTSGPLACGERGPGRLMEPEDILQAIENYFRQEAMTNEDTQPIEALPIESSESSSSIKEKILITSGGTQEPIDSMRVLTNLSTGTTGSRIAEAFVAAGFEVHYLKGRGAQCPFAADLITEFSSFDDLDNKLQDLLARNEYRGVIHAAAVSDFHLSRILNGSNSEELPFQEPESAKISSQDSILLELKPNFKILPRLKEYAKGPRKPTIIGFKFTATPDLEQREKAVKKVLRAPSVDGIVHNDHSEIDRISGKHRFSFYRMNEKKVLGSLDELTFELVSYFENKQDEVAKQ